MRLHREAQRFNVFVMHRRFGKTVWAINHIQKEILTEQLPYPRGAYIAPTQVQARRIAWDYLQQYADPIPGTKRNSQQLSMDYPNGGRIYLLSGENYESIRGQYLDYVIIDEAADINPVAWSQVIRPALADREGGAVIMGTPKGRNNLLADLYERVPDMGPTWHRQLWTHEDTGLLKATEIEALKLEMTSDEFDQELMCSWLAAIQGAYFAKEINELDNADPARIREIQYDPALPVTTAWDLGWADATVVWFFQAIAGEIRVIDLYHTTHRKFPDIIADIKGKGYQYNAHIGPHDLRVHELGSGQTRLEMAAQLGFHFDVCPKISVIDGIKAVQNALTRCYFDRVKTKLGVDALRQYRAEYDPLKRVYSKNPLHDWTSDFADAFRYYVVYMDGGQRSLGLGYSTNQPLDYSKRDKRVV